MGTRQRVNRFELVSRELAGRLEKLTDPDLRKIALAAARMAVSEVGLKHAVVTEALQALAAGGFETPSVRKRLAELVQELDERQWDLQDLVDQNKAPKTAHTTAFRQARAANSLLCAMDSDALGAAQEALYEANTAILKFEEIRRLVEGDSAN